MSTESQPQSPVRPPKTFLEYLRSFGPGLVIVLTWLGAGDIVDMGVAGGNYGYSLMWVLVVAVVMRYLFVSLIAKYQLCNQHQESVLDGLVRLHRWYAPLLFAAAIMMGHILGAYMTVGIGESCRNLTGLGEVWHWALLGNAVALLIVFQPVYARVEALFKVMLAVLSVAFIGTALWVGPSPTGIVEGLFKAEMPEQSGQFGPLLVATAMIGAVGGSIMNLVYPYFLEAKGWRGPEFRRVQLYDFLLAVAAMIVLNLAIWSLGAELLHPHDMTIKKMDDLPRLLSDVLGQWGRNVFYLGVFAAVFTSLVGQSLGLALMGSHAWIRWRESQTLVPSDWSGATAGTRYADHWLYRPIVVWCVVSPLLWTAPGMPDFVTLTLLGNAVQVVLLPMIAGGLWFITAAERCIGREYQNRWWENLLMAILFGLAAYGAVSAIKSVVEAL